MDGIAWLRRVADLLAGLEDGGGEAGRWLLDVVAEYQSGAHWGLRLDETMGLIPGPGQETWWAAENRRRRDEFLRDIAVGWYAAEPSPASKIALALQRYQAAGWLRDRPYMDPPQTSRGTSRELFFRVLKCGKAPGRRTIERALAMPRHETPPIADAADPAEPPHAGNETTTTPSRPRRARHRADRR